MARDPTRFSRVSIGWVDSAQTIVDVDAGDTGPAFSVDGQTQYNDPVRISSTLTVTGSSSFGGGATVDLISSTTHDVDFGSVAAHDSSTVTVGVSNATRGDTFIVSPDSEWSGADYDLDLMAHSGDTTGEVTIKAANSTITAHNPAETVMRLTRIAWSDFI